MTRAKVSWYHAGINHPISAKSQLWKPILTSGDAVRGMCARGDLNQAQPTLVLPELASLSVK